MDEETIEPDAVVVPDVHPLMDTLIALDIAIVALLALGIGYAAAWWRGRAKAGAPVPIDPIKPNRVLIVLFGTVGLVMAINVIPPENVDAAVAAYFILLGNVLVSMKDTD